jgi:hypothetical protein
VALDAPAMSLNLRGRWSTQHGNHWNMPREDHLADLLRSVPIGHLTLAVDSHGRFQAAHRAPGEAGYRVEIKEDPIEALVAALGGQRAVYDPDVEALL